MKDKAPPAKAPIEDHKRHAAELLERPEHKTKPTGYPELDHEFDPVPSGDRP